MAVYAIGDIQGCYKPFRRLLDKIDFVPGQDRLLLAGDLINRGNQSLKVLRFALKHESSVQIVLGNHELHMLAFSERSRPMRTGDTFHDIMNSGERGNILDWLRHQPLAIHDESRNIRMRHAGIHPLW